MSDNSNHPYVILRGYRSGVNAGYLIERNDDTLVLAESRRIWYWDGAASLAEIAVYGCAEDRRKNCKFTVSLERHEIQRSDVSEIIHCQPEGQAMIQGQESWRA